MWELPGLDSTRGPTTLGAPHLESSRRSRPSRRQLRPGCRTLAVASRLACGLALLLRGRRLLANECRKQSAERAARWGAGGRAVCHGAARCCRGGKLPERSSLLHRRHLEHGHRAWGAGACGEGIGLMLTSGWHKRVVGMTRTRRAQCKRCCKARNRPHQSHTNTLRTSSRRRPQGLDRHRDLRAAGVLPQGR
jgi:hypothetical protein